MKRKYIAAVLSFCMIMTSVNVTAFAAETDASDAILEEAEIPVMQEADSENDNAAGVVSDSIANFAAEGDGISIDAVEEVDADAVPDALDTDQISVYASEDADAVDGAQVEDGYTALTAEPNIQFKYDKAEKTLYFKLVDVNDSEHTAMPAGEATKPSISQWASSSSGANGDVAKEVEKIVIGNGITAIGNYDFQTNGEGTYKNVTEVVLPESVKKIGEGAFNAYNVSPCLKSINLENVEEIGAKAFQASNIKEADLSNATIVGSYAFSELKTIENISFKKQSVSIGENAFNQCKSLTIVSAEEISSIGASAFAACDSLKNFSCKKVEEIGASAFSGTGMEQITIKGLKKAGRRVFSTTPALQKISLEIEGDDLTEIDANFFQKCASLKNICFTGTTEQWKNKNFNLTAPNVAIHCKNDPAPAHATCEAPGVKILTCEICGGEYTDGTVEDALGHDYEEAYTVDKAATCTEAGSESRHCTRCGASDEASAREIPALGHDYVAEVTTQPTCTKEGVRTLTCSRCNDIKTEAIPATGEHVWSDWKKVADATAFAAEQQERACATCDAKESRTVGEKLAATLSVNASSVTLKQKQSTSYVKVSNLANGDSIVSWTSTNPKVFTVSGKADGSCKLTGVKKGSAKLEIALASGLKKTISVKVQTKTVATTKISGLAKKLTVKKGEKTTLQPVLTPFTSGQKLTYTSSNKRVATVSSKGVITAKKAGTAKITVKSGSKKVTVTVTVPKAKTTAIKVSDAVSVKKGKTYNLKAKVTPSNSDEKITYSSSNKKIATVSKSGKIKGIKKGEAVITVKSGKIVKKVKVTVK